MENQNLPTEDLKTYGIIKEDLTFSEKLSTEHVRKFLQGYTIVADNDRNRATFQLTDNNTQLKVIFLERDRSLSEILKQSKAKQRSNIRILKTCQNLRLIGTSKRKRSFSIRKTTKQWNSIVLKMPPKSPL